MPASAPLPAPAPDFAAAALAYAAAGFAVFPCSPGAKTPAVAGGFHAAIREEAQLRAWWLRRPAANVGLAIPAGLFVLDLDLHRAPSLLAELSARDVALPATATTETPSGGLHLWLRYSPGSAPPQGVNVAGVVGLDVRASGKGYVLAAPSEVSGRRYVARVPLALDAIADAPAALVALLASEAPRPLAAPAARPAGSGAAPLALPRERVDPMALLIHGAPQGSRNDSLFRAACALRRVGASLAVLVEYAEAVAAKCSPPLSLFEARRIAANVERRYLPAPEDE